MLFQTLTAKLTGYYPFNNLMEGGLLDAKMTPLQTVQGFLDNTHNIIKDNLLEYVAGPTSYISVAADKKIPLGSLLWFPTLDKYYGRRLPFKIVDHGGAFNDKGLTRFDICCASEQDTLDDFLNRSTGHYGVIYYE